MGIKIDQDILSNCGLEKQFDLAELEDAIRQLQIQVASFRERRDKSTLRYEIILGIKLWLARNGLLPWFVSMLCGLAVAFGIALILLLTRAFPASTFWWAIVSQFACTTVIVSTVTWWLLRYSSEEAADPLGCIQSKLFDLKLQNQKWEILCLDGERELARLQSLAKSSADAIYEQELRNLRINERKRLLGINLEFLSGIDFEYFLKEVYELNGYKVRLTPSTGDQGGDLLAENSEAKICIQAKRYAGAVGNKAVQEVYAAMSFYGCDSCAVVTTRLCRKTR